HSYRLTTILSPFLSFLLLFFFFNHPATTEIYTLSLHDALPISGIMPITVAVPPARMHSNACSAAFLRPMASNEYSTPPSTRSRRSEEHTSELQSRSDLVCRLLLEKKKKKKKKERIIEIKIKKQI